MLGQCPYTVSAGIIEPAPRQDARVSPTRSVTSLLPLSLNKGRGSQFFCSVPPPYPGQGLPDVLVRGSIIRALTLWQGEFLYRETL